MTSNFSYGRRIKTIIAGIVFRHSCVFNVFFAFLAVATCSSAAEFDAKDFPYRKETTYFQLFAKQNPGYLDQVGRFADAFIGIVNRDFFKAEFDYPIRVLILEDKLSFQDFLRQRLNVTDPPNFGIYLSGRKMFVSYESSGLGTFAHEIMHPLVERNFRNLPVWAIEGIPSFFEKFYGYWDDDMMVVNWGFQNPWRIEALGSNLAGLDLRRLLTTKKSVGDFYESDIRMISMFLWSQGRFQRFLKLQQNDEKHGFKSCFEAAFEKRLDDIVPLWTKYLNDVDGSRLQIMHLPASIIFRDETEFRTSMERAGVILEPQIPLRP